jgi:serpin B
MKKHAFSALSAAVLALLPAGIFAGEGKPQAELGPVVEGNTAFGLSLFQQLREAEGNLFFSPYSISTALAMTYGGARGQTQREMAEVLRFSLKLEEHHERFSALQSHIKAVQKKGSVRLSVANSLWGQRDYRFLDAFLTNTKTFYGAGLQTVDFARETEAARKAINAWVEKETERKIKELLKPDALTPLTRLVLCNAIYFKGNWASQFDEKQTRMADFFVAADKPVRVPMMNQEMVVKHEEFGDFSAAELPYKGNLLSMVVLLPAKLDGLPSLEKFLTARRLQECLSELDGSWATSVNVQLPRFKTTSWFDLGESLKKMGLAGAFWEDADFTGMASKRPLFLSKVVHKALVEVNEEGTEAAAATAVEPVGAMLTVFNANHPFLFLIRERQTGSILFLGRLADPTVTGE